MKLLLDMVIPIEWESFLGDVGWDTVHLSKLDNRPVKDLDVMQRAREEGRVLFTHDLDFGTLLELAGKSGPSVFQINARDIMVPQIGASTARVMRELEARLEKGALIVVDMETARARVAPIPVNVER